MIFSYKELEIINRELKRINKIYFDELKKYEKENIRYKNMVNQLEDIIVKLSNHIEEKEKC